MGLNPARFILPLLLLLPVQGTDLSTNGTSSEEAHGSRTSRRIVRLYSGTRPKPIVCAGEGFQADPTDCSIFHRCMKNGNGRFVSFRFQCGPGTIYDPEKEICSHPQNTKRTECGAIKDVPHVEFAIDNEISRELPSPLSTRRPTEITTNNKHGFSTETTKNHASEYPWVSASLYSGEFVSNPPQNKQQQTKSPKASSIKREATASSYSTTPLSMPPLDHLSTPAKIVFQNSASGSQYGDICKSNGFMGDSEDCRKFYRCISNQKGGFIKYEFMCSDPTIWDNDKQACNHAWAVTRSRCGRGSIVDDNNDIRQNKQDLSSEYTSASRTGSLPSQTQLQINYGLKVTQTQTQISNGSVIQNQTQINYGDGSKEGKPNVIQNQTQISKGDALSQTQTQINYGDEAVQTQLQIDHSKESSQAQTQISQSTSTTKTTQHNEQHSVSSTNSNNGCTESGFMGDSEDCKKFYRCVDNGRGGFIRYEFSCGEGTVWDSKIEACNHAWAVKECGGKGSSEVATHSTTKASELPSTSTTTKITTTTTTTTQNYHASTELEDDNDIPYGNQPSSSSTTTTQSYYSPTELEADNDIPYGNQPTSPPTSKPIEATTAAYKEPQSTSDNKCRTSGFMGDNKDCKKFYRCVDNGNGGYTRYELTCGEGTVWDQRIEACNHAWAVENCGKNIDVEKNTEKSTTTNGILSTSTQAASQLPPQNDDYDTGYGQQPQHDEPSTTITTSTVKPTTTTLQSVSSSDSSVGNTCTSNGFMGDNNDCKKFYRCVDNGNGAYTKYEFSCGEGTVWDPEIQACNHAWAVQKCGGNTVEDINKVETTTLKESAISSSSTTHSSEPDDNNDASYGQSSQEPQSTSSTSSYQDNPNLESNECKTSGFMGDRKDCKRFYRCVDNGYGTFTRYEFSCGEGTVWDQSIEACNHAWAVNGRCSSSENYSDSSHVQSTTHSFTATSEKYGEDEGYNQATTHKSPTTTISSSKPSNNQCSQEGFYGDENNCKDFFRCVDNGQGGFIKYEFTCGEGTIWNQDIQACDHESSNSQCKVHAGGSTTKLPNTENNEMLTESTTKTSESSLASSSSSSTESINTSQKPQSSGTACEHEGFYGDPNDCKKFYRCVDNGKGGLTKYDFSCGDGTIWDQEILACNHDNSNSKCVSSVTSSGATTTTTDTESENSATAQESQANQRPTPASTWSDQCTMEGFYANTNDCKKFYRCVDNGKGGYTKYDFACGDGTVWVQEIQACDYDNGISSCSHTTSKPQTTGEQQSTLSPSSTSQVTTVSDNAHKENDEYPIESSSKPETSDECTSEGFFGNNNDCTRFYRCVDNGKGGYTKYDFTCGEGTAWDSNIQTCNHISEVENCQNTNQDSQPSKPNQDEGSSQSTESTNTGSTSGGSSKPSDTNHDKCEQEGYYGNTQDCTKFYRCVDNGIGGYTKYDFTCGEGTIWDQDVTTCNHPQDVVNPSCNDDGDNQPPEQSSSTESSSVTSSTGATEDGNQGSSNCSQESSSKKPESQKIKCEKAGFFADPNDCKKFYRCVDWDGDGKRFSIYHFDCGEGTIWDPQLETCNHEDSVSPPRDCSGTQSGNVTQGTSSSTTTTEKSTTTEQSSTTESTTTTQSTTEESTTQQTSSELTTEQASTTEKTTTQESNASEQTTTTTEQTTTSEKTSQPTTSEQTTTEQTTTIQPPTTQETTSSQQTTTQETTSSEQTTTKEMTTTEHTTTQQSTTSEQTTQETVTSEQSTQSSSTEQTTTQQSSTTEHTTDEPTTGQQTATTEQQTATTEQSSTTTESSEQTTTEQEKTTTEGTTASTDGSQSTTESNQGTTQETPSSEKDCPETEDDQHMYVCPTSFRRHPKYCNMFYQCTEDNDSHDVKIAMFKCPNNTIYDDSKTQCVEEDKADKKCNGQKAQRHRVKRLNSNFKEPIEASLRKHTCSAAGYYPYDTNSECSGIFLKCQTAKSGKLRGYVYRCPEGYTYWSISKRCEKKEYMKGCKQIETSWRDRWELPIERKNIAK